MTFETPVTNGWTCFHCGETFTDREKARLHFGNDEASATACQIDIKAFREMEKMAFRCRSEGSDTDRAMHRMSAEHEVALRREEEKGYARGLRDARIEMARALASEVPFWRWGEGGRFV